MQVAMDALEASGIFRGLGAVTHLGKTTPTSLAPPRITTTLDPLHTRAAGAPDMP